MDEPRDIASGLMWYYIHSEREPDYDGLEKAIVTALKEAASEAVSYEVQEGED